ncbi:hypothetical protein BaRGS_00015303 [Batillaria attramentaria]|uniref:Uncharacterized protein n=1 Tax=Batillaria attramentaria TaxID=370345 RepID=A0ABD0L1J8_9CAEN
MLSLSAILWLFMQIHCVYYTTISNALWVLSTAATANQRLVASVVSAKAPSTPTDYYVFLVSVVVLLIVFPLIATARPKNITADGHFVFRGFQVVCACAENSALLLIRVPARAHRPFDRRTAMPITCLGF